MKKLASVGIVTLFAFLAIAAYATQPLGTPTMESQQYHQRMDKSTSAVFPEILRSRNLIGMRVENPNNEHLGTIKDVVLTADKKHVSYLALKADRKLFAVPCAAFQHPAGSKVLILNKDLETLRASQGFDKKNWPYMASVEFGPVSEQLYAAQPTELLATPIADRRLSKMIDLNVRDSQNHKIGQIRDVAIDLRKGSVVYGIVDLSMPVHLTRARLAAVPWTNLTIDTPGKVAHLPAGRSTLEAIAFRSNDYPNLADASFARRTYERFNRGVPPADIYGYTAPGPARPGPAGTEQRVSATFDPARITTITGKVQSLAIVREADKGKEVQLTLRTDDGRLLSVELAPRSFLRKQAMLPVQGEPLEIKGCLVERNGQTLFLASQIDRHGKVLLIRDAQGLPRWHSMMHKGKGTQGSMEPVQ